MKIAILGGANTVHVARWVKAISDRGIQVLLLTQQESLDVDWGENTSLVTLPCRNFGGYFLNVATINRAVATFGPDILHAHYAGGYGLSLLLASHRPKMLSVWGADVYDVPKTSLFHRWLVRRILLSPDKLTSTSHVMADQVRSLGIDRDIPVVAFGIDSEQFSPAQRQSTARSVRIGLVKTMHPKYGVDTLLRAFALLTADAEIAAGRVQLELQIVGGGPQLDDLQSLARELGIADDTEFTGLIDHDRVPECLHGFDIYAAPSRLDSESFGVAIIEASACGLPVVVSDAGGLPEVVDDGVTGFVVPRERPDLLAAKLKLLVLDSGLRAKLGRAGRARVKRDYEWSTCVDQMIEVYRRLIATT